MIWVCLDIETADAPEEAIQAVVDGWKPPANYKNGDTIEAKRQEAASRIRERAALLDASPIICISMIEHDGAKILLHTFRQQFGVTGWREFPFSNEKTMLRELRKYLDFNFQDMEVALVGHNIRSFDLPKLRQAYIRHELKLPELFRPRLDDEPPMRMVDTMSLVRSFSMEMRDERFISLDRVATILGIDRPKQLISGADVPALYRQGSYLEIATYAAIDCSVTTRAFMLMTGQAPYLT